MAKHQHVPIPRHSRHLSWSHKMAFGMSFCVAFMRLKQNMHAEGFQAQLANLQDPSILVM